MVKATRPSVAAEPQCAVQNIPRVGSNKTSMEATAVSSYFSSPEGECHVLASQSCELTTGISRSPIPLKQFNNITKINYFTLTHLCASLLCYTYKYVFVF